jgi:hypothetical protein
VVLGYGIGGKAFGLVMQGRREGIVEGTREKRRWCCGLMMCSSLLRISYRDLVVLSFVFSVSTRKSVGPLTALRSFGAILYNASVHSEVEGVDL